MRNQYREISSVQMAEGLRNKNALFCIQCTLYLRDLELSRARAVLCHVLYALYMDHLHFTVSDEEPDPVEPVLARLQASLETLPRPVSPLCQDIPECDPGPTISPDQDGAVALIQHSRRGSEQPRE